MISGRIKENIRQAIRKRGNRSQVQGSTFRVKEKEGIKASKSPLNFSFCQIIANLASNFEFGLTKLTLFS
jgi:hypothetical protein